MLKLCWLWWVGWHWILGPTLHCTRIITKASLIDATKTRQLVLTFNCWERGTYNQFSESTFHPRWPWGILMFCCKHPYHQWMQWHGWHLVSNLLWQLHQSSLQTQLQDPADQSQRQTENHWSDQWFNIQQSDCKTSMEPRFSERRWEFLQIIIIATNDIHGTKSYLLLL